MLEVSLDDAIRVSKKVAVVVLRYISLCLVSTRYQVG
jgi:hypothetical protein